MTTKNRDRVSEPVKVTQDDTDFPMGGMIYSHPSYGQARFSRVSGYRGQLYGSKVDSNTTVELTVSTSKCRQDLGRDWYYEEDEVVRVCFTQTQFAELISNMNAAAIPCTISYREALGIIKYAEMPRELDYIKEEIKTQIDTQAEKISRLQEEAKRLLTKTGNLKKAEKEQLLAINAQIAKLSSSDLPFYAKSAEETINKATQEAKVEIEAFNLHAVTTLGLKVLEDVELVKNLLEDKSN